MQISILGIGIGKNSCSVVGVDDRGAVVVRRLKLCGHGWRVQHGVVSFFGLGWRDIADGFQKASVVEPIDPFERSELHGFEVAPWFSAMDDLGCWFPGGTAPNWLSSARKPTSRVSNQARRCLRPLAAMALRQICFTGGSGS